MQIVTKLKMFKESTSKFNIWADLILSLTNPQLAWSSNLQLVYYLSTNMDMNVVWPTKGTFPLHQEVPMLSA